MRTAFFKALVDIAKEDERIFLIVGDLGFKVVDEFVQRFPQRYLNPGVAEQNMTGVATGLALCGKVVFTYSIANFPTLRCLEQIRNDVCYHKANVKIVAVGGGFVYGALGMTHFATEDLAIMRALPEMTVIAPGDPAEAEAATKAITELDGPCYLRLGRAGESLVHSGEIDFKIGKAITVREGNDITLISTGSMLENAVQLAERLYQQGVEGRVLSMHTLKPFDEEAVINAASETRAVFTLEEHSIIGGLGGAAAEVLAESGITTTFKRFGLPSTFSSKVGDQDYIRKYFKISVDALFERLQPILKQL